LPKLDKQIHCKLLLNRHAVMLLHIYCLTEPCFCDANHWQSASCVMDLWC